MENTTLTNCSLIRKEFAIVASVNAVAALVSLLACLVAIFIIILFKKWQSFGQRLILYLMISTTLLSIGIVFIVAFGGVDTGSTVRGFCAFTGFAAQVEAWMVINTTSAITVYLFLGIVCSKLTGKYEILYILFIFVLPLVFNWIPFINNLYGHSGVWCWICSVDFQTCGRLVSGQVLQLALYYVPLFVILSLWFLLYLVILCKLRGNSKRWKGIANDTDKHCTNKLLKSETLYLLVYPLIYFVLSIPLIITRIVGWANPGRPIAALLYISGICYSLNGAIFVVAFVLESDTRQRLRWSHIRAAFKNYNSEKGVAEYEVGEAEEVEGTEEAGHYKHVPYKQLTDDTVVDEI